MRNATQRALDSAQDDGNILESFPTALRIHQRGAIGPLAANIARRIGVVATDFAIGGVAVDHRIHVAGGYAEKQIRLAQRLECSRAVPLGLRDDADPETLRLQHAPDHRHAKARMVDVGVASDQNDVATVPAQRLHFGARHRQELGRTQARSPMLAVAAKRFCRAREKRNVDRGVHARHSGGGSR